MRNTLAHLICGTGLMLICITGRAQTITLKAPPANIVIDGKSEEWGDNLTYFNAEKKLHYTIANDKTNLYLVIKTDDPVQQFNILSSGITFSIDPKGRKKSTYYTTFPLKGLENTNGIDKTLKEKKLMADIAQLSKIEVKGFKDISDGQINFENTFDIKTDIDIDDKGFLIYEEAIPLNLFHANEFVASEWSYNIKLNGVKQLMTIDEAVKMGYAKVKTVVVAVPAGSGPPSRGAIEDAMRGSSSRQSSISPLPLGINMSTAPREIEVSKPIDFWGKFTLAK
jgi:hypothetical protein